MNDSLFGCLDRIDIASDRIHELHQAIYCIQQYIMLTTDDVKEVAEKALLGVYICLDDKYKELRNALTDAQELHRIQKSSNQY